LEAFSGGVLAIAITLLILEVRLEQAAGQSLAEALRHALPEIGAYAASFLQIGIIWANPLRVVPPGRPGRPAAADAEPAAVGQRVVPVAANAIGRRAHRDSDASTAVLLYGGTLTASAGRVQPDLAPRGARRTTGRGVSEEFLHDVDVRYLLGWRRTPSPAGSRSSLPPPRSS